MDDESLIRRTLELAEISVRNGNHPFGALLYDSTTNSIVLEAENVVNTPVRDCTGHAETTLCRKASSAGLGDDVIARCILYTSTEPCIMCAGAIHWLGVKNVVFGCPEHELYRIAGDHPENPTLRFPMAKLVELAGAKCQVRGPILEKEAVAVHERYGWK